MKAEDTVLTDGEIVEVIVEVFKKKGAPLSKDYILGRISSPVIKSLREAQAEITWNAREGLAKKQVQAHGDIRFEAGIREGEQRFAEKISFNRTMDMMLKKKEGIKEVVDELRLRGDMSMNFPFGNIRKEAWLDVLEEWGIKEGQ